MQGALRRETVKQTVNKLINKQTIYGGEKVANEHMEGGLTNSFELTYLVLQFAMDYRSRKCVGVARSVIFKNVNKLIQVQTE